MVGWLFSYIKINKSENIYISNLFLMIYDVSSIIPFNTRLSSAIFSTRSG